MPTQSTYPKWLIAVVAVLIILVTAGIGVIAIMSGQQAGSKMEENTGLSQQSTSQPQQIPDSAKVSWSFDGTAWQSMQNTPACAEPLEITSPVDLKLVTSMLYPGQVRGGDFKPHGGFRLDNLTTNAVEVKMPISATLYRGSRYIESGETQYLLDFVTPCGIFLRFDHLYTLSPDLMALVEAQLPAAKADESRTYNFEPTVTLQQGALLATEVGFKQKLNVGFDFGVYDLRAQNTISKNTSWALAHANKKELGYFGICWLRNLSGTDSQIALSLPGSGTEGKTSDYCQ